MATRPGSVSLFRLDVAPVRAAGLESGLSTAAVEARVAEAYDESATRLRAFALRATRDPAGADDLVQEAFLRLVVEVRSGRQPDNMG